MSIADITRRDFLRVSGATALLSSAWPKASFSAPAPVLHRLRAGPATAALLGAGQPGTEVWSYNATVPGPQLRVPAGVPVRVALHNGLSQETTVHWHGIRLPNAMDGVPGLTQPAIAPGEEFLYEFTPPDAGTFWYHPHVRGFEQVGRGLYGILIVEEPVALPVDRDVVWVLDDWRLTKDGSISDDFGRGHDMSHAGRIGNTVTIGGQRMPQFEVRSNERIRLRLVNVANARNFGLVFEGLQPRIIAIDGQPVEPHEPSDGIVVLGAAMRIDLLLECTASPGARTRVTDSFYPRYGYDLTELIYTSDEPLTQTLNIDDIRLPANSIPEPQLDAAQHHELVLAGGAMGGMRGATLDGEWTDIRSLARSGLIWAMGGVVRRPDEFDSPIVTASRGSSHVIAMRNDSAFPHPMHLHGHHFRVTKRNGAATRFKQWQDTVLVMPREQVEIAFKADNPGDWLFHCHVLEHMAAGMSGVVKVI